MKIIYERHPIGSRVTIDGQDVLVCGTTPDGRPLFARKWTDDVPDAVSFMTSDTHLFAQSVRQIRTEQGRAHDAYATRGVKELFGKYRGGTVVIVACGPSMPKAREVVRELHQTHNHIVIGTNVSMLFGYDFLDYYMLLCWLSQTWWWRGIDTTNLNCITSFHTPTEIIRDFPNRLYFDDTFLDVTLDKPDTRRKWGVLDGGLSITYSALHMAFRMGAARIVLVGCDLAYTDYMDHPNDPLNYEKSRKRTLCIVKDIHGNAVIADSTLLSQRDLMKGQIILLEEYGIEVINITDNGILDIGCRMSPQEYLAYVKEGNWYLPNRKYPMNGNGSTCSASKTSTAP